MQLNLITRTAAVKSSEEIAREKDPRVGRGKKASRSKFTGISCYPTVRPLCTIVSSCYRVIRVVSARGDLNARLATDKSPRRVASFR